VTKGDQYDVREASAGGGGEVRNLGKPVELCARYYEEGADEVAFLNITAFRGEPLADMPMLGVLEAASEKVFVPLTVRPRPPPAAPHTQDGHEHSRRFPSTRPPPPLHPTPFL
jgi:hypothetical protein